MSYYLKVYGRLRPSASENGTAALAVLNKTAVKVELEGKSEKLYTLHRIFDETASQNDVFNTVAKSLVEECTDGINGTIFAYGQTGSGKTHTMLGPPDSWSDPVHKGLIPRSIEYLFDNLEKKVQECQKFTFNVSVEFVELYNEEIFDLLSDISNKIQLRDTGKEIELIGAKSERIDNSLDMMNVVNRGWQSRRTATTAMNRDSSRSHALIIIKIITDEVTGGLRTSRTSTLNLVDLAGSERQSHTKATGERLKEATNINSSLTVLGRCIRILSKPTAQPAYIPYRDSHLTHILKNSLGGNSKTAVVVNMHPDRSFVAESSSTLQFAEACTHIKNKVLRNVVMTGDQEDSYKKAIQELRQEVEQTRANAKKEFANQLAHQEEQIKRIQAEMASLKSDNNELRTKYNIALVKYACSENRDIPLDMQKYLKCDGSSEELSAKNQTLALELATSDKMCQNLQEKLDEYREKFQETINSSMLMQTPCAKQRRQSSRNLRRETQYRPSPARLAQLSAAESEVDDGLSEAHNRIAVLEAEIDAAKEKTVRITEEKCAVEQKLMNVIGTSEKRVSDLEEDLAHERKEVELYKNRVLGCNNSLARILEANKVANADKDAAEKRVMDMEAYCNQQINDMEVHHNTLVAKLNAEIASLQRGSDASMNAVTESLQKAVAEVETLKVKIEMEKKKSSETDALLLSSKAQVEAKTVLVAQLESTVNRLGAEVLTLKKTIDNNMNNIEELKRQLEDSQGEENRLQTLVDQLQISKQELIKEHQEHTKKLKARETAKLEDVQKTLHRTKEELENETQRNKKQRSEANMQFDAKMEEMRRTFETQMVVVVKGKEQVIRKELMSAHRHKESEDETKIAALQKQIENLEKARKEDSETIAEQMLTNKDRKLNYVNKLRQDIADKDMKIATLQTEIDRLNREKAGEGSSRRVLRSRNVPN